MSELLRKVLGIYVTVIGCIQLILLLGAFLLAKFFNGISEGLFLATAVNPRFGLISLEMILYSEGGTYTGIFAIGSALISICLGVLLLKNLVSVFTYLIFEICFGGPNLLLLLLHSRAEFGPDSNNEFFLFSHFAVRTIVLILATVFPILFAVGSLLSRQKVNTLTYIPK